MNLLSFKILKDFLNKSQSKLLFIIIIIMNKHLFTLNKKENIETNKK